MAERRPGVVSSIITVYNRPVLLAEAVQSVLAQTYRPIQIVIVDDGSTDDTPAVARRFAAEHPAIVSVITLPHAGHMHLAWPRGLNAGLRVADGEFVQILDSDDVLMPEKFALQVRALRERPDCGVSYGYLREYALGDPPRSRPARRTGVTFTSLFPELLRRRIWAAPSPLYRRSVIDAAGPFHEVIDADWEFECRIAALGVRLHHCRVFVADVRNTHAIEGRRQPGRPRAEMNGAVDAHEMMLASARTAGVGPDLLAAFARRMFALARACAATGFEPDARRCLATARTISSPARRWQIDLYAAVSRIAGWQLIGAVSERVTALRSRLNRWLIALVSRWRHRLSRAGAELSQTPVVDWPAALRSLWAARGGRTRLTR